MGHRLSLLITASAIFLSCASREPIRGKQSGALPATPIETLEGSATDLAGFLHGRPALVSLWATWCDTCVDEAPALNRLDSEARKGGDAVVVGVAVGETTETVRAFATTRKLAYTQLVDPEFRFADTLGERQVPATLVVDRTGRIVFRGKALDAESLAAFRRVAKR
ncbi:MAG TPA: TlpA disulfide reductase family protein [Polyangiaceae bacterium]|nr:TlpA disulfide reductase family protein [Polyangiaceae bacterium]